MRDITWSEVFQLLRDLHHDISLPQCRPIYGIPRGGSIVAGLLESKYPRHFKCVDQFKHDIPHLILIDDIFDSGATAQSWTTETKLLFYTLIDKTIEPWKGEWVRFPWEMRDGEIDVEDNIRRILEVIGEDPTREGLRDTPKRFMKAFVEMTNGRVQDPKKILKRTFGEDADEMVVLHGIRFSSVCEHHLLPFTGTASVAYIPAPGEGVVGISKLARLVECFAKRLQIQERLVTDVAKTIEEVLSPLGVGVVIKAHHSCMWCRGVLQPDTEIVTSCMLGMFRVPEVRQEFLELIK